jgi:hypothetical protein
MTTAINLLVFLSVLANALMHASLAAADPFGPRWAIYVQSAVLSLGMFCGGAALRG